MKKENKTVPLKTFTACEPGLNAVIKVSEMQGRIAKLEGAGDQAGAWQEFKKILVIVTGGEYDPADESYDISRKHAAELVNSFLSL